MSATNPLSTSISEIVRVGNTPDTVRAVRRVWYSSSSAKNYTVLRYGKFLFATRLTARGSPSTSAGVWGVGGCRYCLPARAFWNAARGVDSPTGSRAEGMPACNSSRNIRARSSRRAWDRAVSVWDALCTGRGVNFRGFYCSPHERVEGVSVLAVDCAPPLCPLPHFFVCKPGMLRARYVPWKLSQAGMPSQLVRR